MKEEISHFNKLSGPWGHFAKQTKSDRGWQILFVLNHIWNLKHWPQIGMVVVGGWVREMKRDWSNGQIFHCNLFIYNLPVKDEKVPRTWGAAWWLSSKPVPHAWKFLWERIFNVITIRATRLVLWGEGWANQLISENILWCIHMSNRYYASLKQTLRANCICVDLAGGNDSLLHSVFWKFY